jgi:alpha-galactosidase
MIGGELPSADEWTTSLLTNREVLEVDQHSTGNHPVVSTDKTVIWIAEPGAKDSHFIAIFNRTNEAAEIHYSWNDMGLADKEYEMRDLWEHQDLKSASSLAAKLPPHGSVLYRVKRVTATAH